jgi:hypothetical protein
MSPQQIALVSQLREIALSKPLEIGPYSISIEERHDHEMPVRRRRECMDLTHSRILIRKGLTPDQWLHALVHALVRLVHYSQAVLLHESTEEHLTHSLASGLSQMVRRNPALAWALVRAMSPHARRNAQKTPPQRLTIGQHCWAVKTMTVKTAARLRLFGQADLDRRRVELDPALSGTQLAVIFLHEVVHGLHHEAGVTDRTPLKTAHATQAKCLLQFFRMNPSAAGWWFQLLDPGEVLHHRRAGDKPMSQSR